MGEPFIAKGSEPEWQMIYKVLKHMEVGQVITFEMLDAVLGRTFTDSRTPIYRAKAELLTNDRRLVRSVSGVGYRIAESTEHEDVARGHIRTGHRQITKAKDLVTLTSRSGMPAEKRRSLDSLQMHLAKVAQATGALNRRVENGKQAPVEEALEVVRQKDKAASKIPEPTNAEVAAKLDRLESLFTQFRDPAKTES